MSRSDARARLAVAAAAVSAFGVSLFSRGWPRDDRWLILEHPLIRAGWRGAWELVTSGYVQPLMGAETPIHEWRPLLSLTFLLQRVTTGFAPLPFHAVNLALHAAVAVLVLEVLCRRLPERAAFAGALFFAVLPVHAEVVAYLTSRSEMLAALSILGGWLLLGAPRRPSPREIAAGALIYLAGSLSKEHALLFPLFLALADWIFAGQTPWSTERRRTYLALGLAAAVVLLGRVVVLPAVAHGGSAYFTSTPPLSRLLTLSRFWVWFYARPAVTGVGLCTDFARPFFPDAGSADLAAWLSLAAVLGLIVASIRGAARREPWSFWFLGPCLFLLPTTHLLMNLDTLGAQRFLYVPCVGLAALAGSIFASVEKSRPALARAVFAVVFLGLGARAAVRAADWGDDLAYYRAAVTCNPVSAKARAGLGAADLRAGRFDDGEADLKAAVALDPRLFDPAMNLSRLAYDRRDFASARRYLDEARKSRPDAPDGLTMLALLEEREGRVDRAAAALARAVAISPRDPVARFNFARSLARLGRPADAAEQLLEFLRLAPDDPDADAARRWLEELSAAGKSK